MPSAENQMPPIGHNTPITLGLVLAVVGALGLAAVDHYRVGLIQEAQVQAELKTQKAAEIDASVHLQTELRLQRIEDHWADIASSMKSLQSAVDELRGVRAAKGRVP